MAVQTVRDTVRRGGEGGAAELSNIRPHRMQRAEVIVFALKGVLVLASWVLACVTEVVHVGRFYNR